MNFLPPQYNSSQLEKAMQIINIKLISNLSLKSYCCHLHTLQMTALRLTI